MRPMEQANMPETALVWPTGDLTRALQNVVPGLQVLVVPETGSTNSDLMTQVREGKAVPTLLVAERQTAGRGRMSRPWQQGAAGAALSFSLALPLAPRQWSGLSLAVGVAVAQSLHPQIQLKWPNDLWWQGRKLAGILIETAAAPNSAAAACAMRWVIVGVGINVQLPAAPTAAWTTAPAALQEVLGPTTAPKVLQHVALPLLQAVRRFEQTGFTAFAAAFAERDALRGRTVCLSDGTEGVAAGVDREGALCVQTAQGLRHVSSLEISVRPGPATVGECR